MHAILLGSAAGGGFPQWNCHCPVCRVGRTNPRAAHSRRQSSLAISADGHRWFLVNASPDVHAQLALLPFFPSDAVRHVPIDGIILTDAELDHSLGIALLREGRALALYCTDGVHEILERGSSILPLTRFFARVTVTSLSPGKAVELRGRDGEPVGLSIEVWPVAGDPPRFAAGEPTAHTVGILVRDEHTQGALAFVPGCGGLDAATIDWLAQADVVLFDGTFWSDDELIALGISDSTATTMGHVPISGTDGSLFPLARIPSRRRVYTHINNTNPVLLEDSPERAAVVSAGLEIGADGMTFTL
jgi:pyrroloquinoline quinone biosynthesis protein B